MWTRCVLSTLYWYSERLYKIEMKQLDKGANFAFSLNTLKLTRQRGKQALLLQDVIRIPKICSQLQRT